MQPRDAGSATAEGITPRTAIGSMLAPALAVEDLRKSYGPTIALRRVSFQVLPGEVHALVGENGAGKSTLVKILSGVVQPDGGRVLLEGAPFAPGSLMQARASGVSTAFQELSLVPNLSVAANLMLPRLVKGLGGLIATRANQARAAALLDEFGAADIPPAARVGALSLAQKQRLEIVRALSHRPRLLILDEPTAALIEPEWLFGLVERLAAAGVAILYISHRLAEVRRLCHRATVLRNGESMRTVELAGTSDAQIFSLMVGKSPDAHGAAAHTAMRTETPALSVRHLRASRIADVSFDLYGGEILGVAALEGQGQRQLFRMLAGAMPLSAGVTVAGRPVRLGTPAEALGAGIGFLPEERKTEGIFLGLSTAANISLPVLGRLRRLGLINRRRERAVVDEQADRVELARRYLGMKISGLSGGNQQKALLARVLLSGARILVLFDPTRGVDVGTKQVVYDVIRDFAARGGSVLIYSTELEELVQLVARCLVLYRGGIVGELSGETLTEAGLVSLATGHGEAMAA